MPDMRHKLSVKLTQRYADVLAEIELRCDDRGDAEFWALWNAVNGAASRLGLPCDDTPVTLAPAGTFNVEKFLDGVIAEGKESGGELTL